MKIFRWAIRNIRRMTAKSIALCLILTAVASLVMMGFTIRDASEQKIADARSSLGNIATLQVVFTMPEGGFQRGTQSQSQVERKTLTAENAELLKDSQYIIGYNYTANSRADASIEPIVADAESSSTAAPEATAKPNGNTNGNQGGFGAMQLPSFNIQGVRNLSMEADFLNGTKKIIDGRSFNEDEINNGSYVVVIDELLAKNNNLKVGDTFDITTVAMGGRRQNEDSTATTVEPTTKTVSIIGIYSDSTAPNLDASANMMIRNNTFYSPVKMAQEFNALSRGLTTANSNIQSATYLLSDPEDITALRAEAVSLGLSSDSYTLDFNEATFTRMVAPLNSLASFALIMVVAVILIGGLITFLLVLMSTRERKGEIGILRAIGASKSKIASQFIVETLAIGIIALILGGVIGGLSSKNVANTLLQQQVTASQSSTETQTNTQANNRNPQFIGGGQRLRQNAFNPITQNVTPIQSIEAKAGFIQLVEMISAGLLICMIASLSSIYWISKAEPMTILSNRN